MDLTADLDLALRLADAADAISTRRFRAGDLRVETKPDLSPVTDADRDVELAIREVLGRERPDDAVIGEEFGGGVERGRRWVLDPIDGTKNFVRGVPVWGTLIGLRDGADTLVGAVSAPALGRRWWAARGLGAFAAVAGGEPTRLGVSGVAEISDSFLGYASLEGWAACGRLEAFVGLLLRAWRTRGYGDFFAHMLVAEGVIDAAAEPDVNEWDLAALHVIVEEAGGEFTDLAGRRGPDGGSIVSSNGRLHAELLRVLGPIGGAGQA